MLISSNKILKAGSVIFTSGIQIPLESGYYKVITIDHLDIPSDLTDFPVCVKLANDSDLVAHATGDSFYIKTGDGSAVLPHEIEYYDPTTGELVLWFKAPVISSSTDSMFRLYYGDAEHTNSENPSAVWDDNYAMVHHFSYSWREKDTHPIATFGYWGSVVKSGSTYYMYYSYGSPLRIGRATSSDGITWTDDIVNKPSLPIGGVGKFDSGQVWLPRVWIESGTWYMLYAGQGAGGAVAIGLATSSDGITWTRQNSGNAVLSGTAGQWDENDCELSSIIKVGSTYYMFYNKLNATRQTGLATSTDLISWTKDVNNPIFGDGRFCGDVFKLGEYYYYICPHYGWSSDFTEFELWRDDAPTFYSADRTFMGLIKSCGVNGAWDDTDEDTPWVLTDSINRDAFTGTNGELWCYFWGYSGSSWGTGVLKSSAAAFAMKGAGIDSKGTHDLRRDNVYYPPYEVEESSVGGALGFNGVRQYGVLQSADFNLNANEPFTWEAVITPSSVTGYKTIMTLRDFANSGAHCTLGLFQSGNDLYVIVRQDDGTGQLITDARTLVIGTSYRVGFSRDSSGNIKVQLNDVSASVGSPVAGEITPDQGPWIGSHYYTGNTNANLGYSGDISEIRISNGIQRSEDWLTAAYNIELGNTVSLGPEIPI